MRAVLLSSSPPPYATASSPSTLSGRRRSARLAGSGGRAQTARRGGGRRGGREKGDGAALRRERRTTRAPPGRPPAPAQAAHARPRGGGCEAGGGGVCGRSGSSVCGSSRSWCAVFRLRGSVFFLPCFLSAARLAPRCAEVPLPADGLCPLPPGRQAGWVTPRQGEVGPRCFLLRSPQGSN